MVSLTQAINSDSGLPPNSYIYKILCTATQSDPFTYSRVDQLAIISSDDSLRFLDAASLKALPDGTIQSVNEKVTCLERANDQPSNIVVTAGRDGLIKYWDKRSRRKAMEIQSPHKLISSLVCDAQKNFVAAGIENPDDGAGVSPVYIWDQRNPLAPTRSYVESHTDTITSLQLHPSQPNLLLSSSTDGLANIFDTSQAEEEDALYQVINHGCAIAHAGFMYPGTDIYAIGTDETMSFYALQSQKEDEEEPAPKLFGDVREKLGCEYVAKMHWIHDNPFVAVGKHSQSDFELIPITNNDSNPLHYEFEMGKSIKLPGAHGEELIRDLFTDIHTKITYTCGEDGFIRAWKDANNNDDDDRMDVDEDINEDEGEDAEQAKKDKKRKEKKEKRKNKKDGEKGRDKDRDRDKARYKPY